MLSEADGRPPLCLRWHDPCASYCLVRAPYWSGSGRDWGRHTRRPIACLRHTGTLMSLPPSSLTEASSQGTSWRVMPDVLANSVRFQPSLGQRESDVVVLESRAIYLAGSFSQSRAGKPCGAAVARMCGAHVWRAFGTVRNLCRMVARHLPPTARKTPQINRISHRAQGCQGLRPQFSDHIMSRRAACIAAASSSITPPPRHYFAPPS